MNVINFQDANCAHCYKCLRNCDVKAIRIKQGQAQIVTDMCIYRWTLRMWKYVLRRRRPLTQRHPAWAKSLLYKKERVVVSLDPSLPWASGSRRLSVRS
ncbi:MAG: hypothetical protein ACLTDV_03700 [Eubacterium sp.]